MISYFRKKFILVSMMALLLVLVTIVGSIGSIAYYRAQGKVNNVLTMLVKNDGQLSVADATRQSQNFLQTPITKESIFQYRYFSAIVKPDGSIDQVDNQHISTVSPQMIVQMANRVTQRRRNQGVIYHSGTAYAYKTKKVADGRLVVFLDETILMSETNEVIRVGILLGLISMVLYTIVLALFSNRAIRPIIQSEKRQREFITNAGHELKTPLAVISANTEMQEMIDGESEWTKSNKQQVARLTRLVGNLISLARMQEQPNIQLEAIPVSKVVTTVTDSFKSIMANSQHQFLLNVQPNLVATANKNYFSELVSILLDNANKYCDDHGEVKVDLHQGRYGRTVILSIGNTFAKGAKVDYNKFFDRFYRGDTAHSNNKKNGFGIGLSMARQIVNDFNGKLSARYEHGVLYFDVQLKRA